MDTNKSKLEEENLSKNQEDHMNGDGTLERTNQKRYENKKRRRN